MGDEPSIALIQSSRWASGPRDGPGRGRARGGGDGASGLPTLTLDAFAVDGAYVAVGERGHILISTDGGETWQQQQVPTRTALTGVYFHDRNLGWVVGHDSAILRTTDGGTTWELVNWAPEDEAPFFDVWFSDADNGVVIGAYGSYYETTDGGTTWSSRWISEDDWHLHKIARSEGGRLYIAARRALSTDRTTTERTGSPSHPVPGLLLRRPPARG